MLSKHFPTQAIPLVYRLELIIDLGISKFKKKIYIFCPSSFFPVAKMILLTISSRLKVTFSKNDDKDDDGNDALDVNFGNFSPVRMSLATRGQCYKTFHRSNLPPFHSTSIIPCWKLLWNGNKLPRYINPRKSRVKITAVIYRCIVL